MQKQSRSVVTTLTAVALLMAAAQPVLSQGENEPVPMPARRQEEDMAGRRLYPAMAPPFETIVADGVPEATIVTSAEPSAVELLAAQELQIYLERTSGAKVLIVARAERPAGFGLLLGPEHAESKRALRDLPQPLGDSQYPCVSQGLPYAETRHQQHPEPLLRCLRLSKTQLSAKSSSRSALSTPIERSSRASSS